MVEVLTGDQTHRFWLKLGSRLKARRVTSKENSAMAMGAGMTPPTKSVKRPARSLCTRWMMRRMVMDR